MTGGYFTECCSAQFARNGTKMCAGVRKRDSSGNVKVGITGSMPTRPLFTSDLRACRIQWISHCAQLHDRKANVYSQHCSSYYVYLPLLQTLHYGTWKDGGGGGRVKDLFHTTFLFGRRPNRVIERNRDHLFWFKVAIGTQYVRA